MQETVATVKRPTYGFGKLQIYAAVKNLTKAASLLTVFEGIFLIVLALLFTSSVHLDAKHLVQDHTGNHGISSRTAATGLGV